MAGCCGIAGFMPICGICGGGMETCGMPICGIPGIGPPEGGAAAGGDGGFEGAFIIRVYSLGPCGAAGGVFAGGVRNACVAPPPGPYEAGGAGAGAAGGVPGTAGGAPDSAPGPNMRVYSPGSCRGGGAAAAGGADGNCDADGNCGPRSEEGRGAGFLSEAG